MDKGHVYWITGLSGAGKTTIGEKLYNHVKGKNSATVFFDGDVLRDVYQYKDYSNEGREKIGKITGRLIKLLSEQGIDIICCFVAMSEQTRSWNRDNFENYHEIYLKVDINELIKRDKKQLYSRALKGEEKNVLGINAEFDEPSSPDIVIENYGDNDPDKVVDMIIDYFNL